MSRAAKARDVIGQFRRKALDDPRWFFVDFLKFPLLEWQYHLINAVLDVHRKAIGLSTVHNHEGKPRVTIRSCHGTGKTQAIAALAHIWNFIFYGKIAATAPKQEQLFRRFLPRYRAVLKSAPEIYQSLVEVLGKDVNIAKDRDWGIALETAVDPDSLAGYHGKPQLFIIDEASSKRLDHMFPVIEGALTTAGSVKVEIGNPSRMEGEFFQHHNRTELADLYYRMHVPYTAAPEYISPQWVEAMRIKYGEDSPIFKIRVLGEFADFDQAILIPYHFIEEAFDADITPDGSHSVKVVAVDVADGGADSTCITAGERFASYDHIKFQNRFNYDPSVAVLESARAAIRMFELIGGDKAADYFVVDANGVGAGTAGLLIEKGYNVIRYMGGESADEPDRYRNRRVQNHIAMADQFTQFKIKIDSKGIEDKETLIRHITAVKRVDAEDSKTDDIQTAKDVKKDLLGESPDCSASLSMFFHGSVASHGVQTATFDDVYTLESALAYEYY